MTKQKLYDLAMASPILLWFGVGAAGSASRALDLLAARAGVAQIALQIASALFLVLAMALLLVRNPPVKKAKGIGPISAGVIGCLTPFLVVAMPRGALSPTSLAFLSALGLFGTVASIYVLLWLGRAFSILPQARVLVTAGPYRFVRHPLYLAEFVIITSRAFELAQPWPLVTLAVAVACQIARMHYEEKVLAETFPAYRTYARHTARLIPGLY